MEKDEQETICVKSTPIGNTNVYLIVSIYTVYYIDLVQ